MTRRFSRPKPSRKQITAADVGRYLKHMAVLHRDPLTGNAAMSEALHEIAAILIAAKSAPAQQALSSFVEQNRFEFEDEIDFQTLPLGHVKEIVARPDLTKSDLSTIGTERFGIPRSRMTRVPREEILEMISASIQHEESLAIISEEAQRQPRTS